MAAPSITIMDESDRSVINWDAGVVQASNESAVFSIYVWNNRNGSTAISDLKDVTITALDIDGSSNGELVAGKWVRANVPKVDGNVTTWTPVGGSDGKHLQAEAITTASDFTIKGTVNDGNKNTTSSKQNYCKVNLKVVVPVNATPGTKTYKIRVNGYYV